MHIHESGEMYLKTIYNIGYRKKNVRAVDIARELNFSKASVSRAISILKSKDHILVSPKGLITLTEQGREISEYLELKYNVLVKYFCLVLKVSEDVAKENACKIEHVITSDLYNAFEKKVREIQGIKSEL